MYKLLPTSCNDDRSVCDRVFLEELKPLSFRHVSIPINTTFIDRRELKKGLSEIMTKSLDLLDFCTSLHGVDSACCYSSYSVDTLQQGVMLQSQICR